MSLYIKIADFSGQDKIAKDKYTESDLQFYIDKLEARYLQDLLGAELYEAFKTDFVIDGTKPTNAKFTAIWDAFAIDDNCTMWRSEGIKKMLGLFIYWEYLRDQPVKNNIAGNQVNQQANSEAALPSETNMYTNYNQALESYWAIQWYIDINPDSYDYDLYNGQNKKYLSFI